MKKITLFLLGLCLSIGALAQEIDEQLDARRRLFINDFIATYEKAYEIEDLDYIKLMFSADALVLTETKQLLKHGAEMVPNTSKKRPYKTLVEDRKAYIDRLTKIFNSNQQVRLSIAGKRIVRHLRHQEVYGISFFQLWTDKDGGTNIESQMPGYVFLMVDFRNNEHAPIIHVRTWQPQSNIKDVTDKYSLGDFRIYDTKK